MVQASLNVNTAARRRASFRRRVPARRRVSYRRARRAPARRFQRRRISAPRPLRSQRQLTKYELVNLNPFDPRCNGVKIPDSNTQPSETTVDENRVVITMDALGNASCSAYMPNLIKNSVAATPAGATSWTWVAAYGGQTNSANTTEIQADYVGYRPVGHGIRLSCSSAPLTITGFCHICIVPVEMYNSSTWQFPTSVSQMINQPWYKRYTLASLTQRSVTVVNKFLDTSATRYIDVDSDAVNNATDSDFMFGNTWCAVIVAVEGAPISTSPLTVDTLVHYEGLPKIGTANSSTPAAEFNVSELQDVSRIATTHPGTFEEGQEDALIASAMRSLFGVNVPSGGFSGPLGGIQGVNTPRLTAQ